MRKVKQVLENIVLVQFTLLIGIVFFQVCLRYFLNMSISWTEEFSRIMFIWMVFIGAVLVLDQGSHFVFDVFIGLLPKKLQIIASILSDLLVLMLLLFIAFWGFKLSLFNMAQRTTIMGISYFLVYMIIPVSLSIMSIIKIMQLLFTIRNYDKY